MQLTLLIGIPASGKSFYARTRRQPIISLDIIRAQLYGDARILGKASEVDHVARERLERLAGDRRDVILDATHVSPLRRQRMIRLARRLGYDRVIGVWLKTPIAECVRRNARRKRPVPTFVLYVMQAHLDRNPPSVEEGFDQLKVIRPRAKTPTRDEGT